MSFTEIFLWPGTTMCQWMGVDPDSDSGLIRWMFNTLFYLFVTFVTLAALWAILA